MPYRNGHNNNRLYRSDDAVIFGVCGGIAEYFDLAPWGVRLLWVLFTFAGFPFSIIAYVALALILKRQPQADAGISPERGWEAGCATNGEMLSRVTQRFAALDKRLQRMEAVVTSPGFAADREYGDRDAWNRH